MDGPIAIAIHRADVRPLDPLSETVDTHFGRAHAVLLCDAEGRAAEIVPNEHVEAAHGAGTAVAGLLTARGVRVAIAADFGPNACRVLEAAGIALWKAPAGTTVKECLERLRDGRLSAAQPRVFS